jgi:hypothetical protein
MGTYLVETNLFCKLWNLQSKPHEFDARENSWRWVICKFIGGGGDDLQRCFCKSLLPPPLSAQLDQHHVAQIEVSIVFMERLVCTWYVAIYYLKIVSSVKIWWIMQKIHHGDRFFFYSECFVISHNVFFHDFSLHVFAQLSCLHRAIFDNHVSLAFALVLNLHNMS